MHPHTITITIIKRVSFVKHCDGVYYFNIIEGRQPARAQLSTLPVRLHRRHIHLDLRVVLVLGHRNRQAPPRQLAVAHLLPPQGS